MLSVGDEVDVKIVSIDYEAMRVNLSIRALLEEGGIAAEAAQAAAETAEQEPADEAPVEAPVQQETASEEETVQEAPVEQ